jgi:hypothetical protein
MSKARDTWYIRLPSGHELKAKSTAAVNHHIQTGTIPKSSRARRSRDEEWMQLEWHAEFTHAVNGNSRSKESAIGDPPPHESRPQSGISARLDPMRLRTVGVRGLLEDLIAALDSTFVLRKLLIAASACVLAGVFWGIVPPLFMKAADGLDLASAWPGRIITAISVVISLVVLAWTNGFLTRMTHIELSTMHPAQWGDARRGFFKLGLRLTIAYLVILGGSLFIMGVMEWLPNVLFEQGQQLDMPVWLAEVAPALLSAVGVIIEVVLFILIGLTWMLAPLLIIEEAPLMPGVREWLGLIRDHWNRIVLAEILTLILGTVVTLPIFRILEYTIGRFPHLPAAVSLAAYGVALTPFIAFMAVANVFIYLDVKYERN